MALRLCQDAGMTRSSRLVHVVLVIIAAVPIVACGTDSSDNSADGTTSSTSASTSSSDAYCAAIANYDEATSNVDTSSPAATIQSFQGAADAARAAASAAPAAARSAHDRLASAAEELVGALKKANPMTMADLEAAQAAVGPALEAKYGNLEKETASVQESAEKVCGLSVG